MGITSSTTCAIAAAIALWACGGGGGKSGVGEGKLLVDLGASEIAAFCSYQVDVEDAPRSVDCGNGLTLTLKNQADCEASFAQFAPNCAATVAQGETCAEAVGADPCSFGGNACAPILACVGQ